MRTVEAADFQAWLAAAGIDAQYSSLCFDGDDDHSRFWCCPEDPAAERTFFDVLLQLLAGPDGTLLVLPYHRSWWCFQDDEDGALPANSPLRPLVKADDASAIAFDAGDRDALLDLLDHVSEVGWNCAHDLYLIPESRSAFAFISHHDVAHVDARDEATLNLIIERMAASGYALPTELPDETFKRPSWMA